MNKTIIILSFLLLSIHLLHAQKFDSGNGDGQDMATLVNTNLGKFDFSVLYKGSYGDGQDTATLMNTNLGNFDFSVLYKGSHGDGQDTATLMNTNLGNFDFSVLYKGSHGDGQDVATLMNTNLGNFDFSVLYKGSHGDGHDVATLINTNLGNFDFSILFKGGNGDGQDVANLSNPTLSLEVIEELVKLDIRLYPNPASRLVTIKANKGNSITYVEVFNVAGQKINTHLSINNTINVSNLSDGMYLLKIVSKNGVVSKHLIVKK